MDLWDVESENAWYMNQLIQCDVEYFKTYTVNQSKSLGQMLADFCTIWQPVKYWITDWEVANMFCSQVPLSWKPWVKQEIMRLRGDDSMYYPIIHFPTFATTLFKQWVTVGAPPPEVDDMNIYQQITRKKCSEQQVQERKYMPISPIGFQQPNYPIRAHDHEAGSSKYQSRKPRCRICTDFEYFRFEAPREEDIKMKDSDDEENWSMIVETASNTTPGSQKRPLEISSDNDDDEVKRLGLGYGGENKKNKKSQG